MLSKDIRTRLELQVEEMIINCGSSRVCADNIVELIEDVISGKREPKERGRCKPWKKFAIPKGAICGKDGIKDMYYGLGGDDNCIETFY